MLVLRRKVGEAIVLNGVITVYVLAVEGERVKLGINAPPDVVIVRQELLDAVAQENRAARRQGQGGEGEGSEAGSGKPGQEPPREGPTGRRDLRAMLDRALSTPGGTLSPRNGHSAELPTESQRTQGSQQITLARQSQLDEPEGEAPGSGRQKPA
jgi:carbon storage regulator